MDFDFFFNKQMYNLIALYGFIFVFFSGMYWGYTFNDNKVYFNSSIIEVEYVNFLNNKFVYTTQDAKIINSREYGNYIAKRITNVTLILTIIGVIFLEIGYRNSAKYKYKKPLSQRLKEFFKNKKENV